MPIHGARVVESPVDRNPARPPRFEPNFLGPRSVTAKLENVEVLTGENVPVAFEKCAPQMLRQRFEGSAVLRIVGVDRVVVQPRANEIVVAMVVQFRALEPRRWNVIHPKRFHPGVADVSRVRRAGHLAADAACGTAVARRQKLPLLQCEVRRLIQSYEQKLRALILVNVVLVAAVTESRCRT